MTGSGNTYPVWNWGNTIAVFNTLWVVSDSISAGLQHLHFWKSPTPLMVTTKSNAGRIGFWLE